MLRSVHSILLLATLSGVAGIAYEVLYSRLLSTYFGDIFYISAAILVSFLLAIALGALVAHRFSRFLAYIEFAIGLYALGVAAFFATHAQALVQWTAAISPSDPVGFVGIVAALLVFPAFLIGFSIPIFSIYVHHYRPRTDVSAGFRHTYLVYNVGAALAILAIEFALLRTFGITAALVTAAAVNGIVGLVLLRIPAPPQPSKKQMTEVTETLHPPRIALVALFLASVASGIFQLFILKVANAVFGPLNENFAIVLVAVFLGIAMGSWLVGIFTYSFRTYLLVGSLIVMATFLLVTPLIYVWAYAQSMFALALGISVYVKIVLLAVFGIAGFTFFGGTIPLLLRSWPGNAETPGKALAIASAGNALGFLTVIFVLHQYLPMYAGAAIAAVLVFTGACMLGSGVRRARFLGGMALLVAVFGSTLWWPGSLLAAGYTVLQDPRGIAETRERVRDVASFQKYGDTVNILTFHDGTKRLTHNGYVSLNFSRGESPSSLVETIAGASPALFGARGGAALVFGLGSGITAGATAHIASTTKVVEINPAMENAVSAFQDRNTGFRENERVTVTISDGIVELFSDGGEYDVIVNTVSSPAYYSAGKLWTKEVFNRINEKLAPGGIYSAWVDGRIGKHGMQIQMKTTDAVFADCVYLLLNTSYFNTICSNEPLTITDRPQHTWPAPLQEKFARYGITDIPAFLTDLVTTPDPALYNHPDVPLNTLNRPVLEFVSLHPVSGDRFGEFLSDIANAGFYSSPETGERLNETELARKCAHIQTLIPWLVRIDPSSSSFVFFRECID